MKLGVLVMFCFGSGGGSDIDFFIFEIKWFYSDIRELGFFFREDVVFERSVSFVFFVLLWVDVGFIVVFRGIW